MLPSHEALQPQGASAGIAKRNQLQTIDENMCQEASKNKKVNKIAERAKMTRKSWVQNGSKRQKCPGPTREQHFYWRKRDRRRGIERASAPKSDSKLPFLKALCWESFFKNVLATEGGEHIFEKRWEKIEAKQKCKQKCMLQLAFLIQKRIKVHPAQFFVSSLGSC